MNQRFFLRQIRRYVLLAAFPALIVGAAAYLYFVSQPQVYSATATLYVQRINSGVGVLPNAIDYAGSAQLATTYTQMVNSPVVLSAAEASLRKKYPGSGLGNVTTSQPVSQTSPLFSVTVTDHVPTRAVEAVNAVMTAFTDSISRVESSHFAADVRSLLFQQQMVQGNIRHINREIVQCGQSCPNLITLRLSLAESKNAHRLLSTSIGQAKVTRDSIVNSVNVFSPAIMPTTPSSPHPTRGALLATVLALLLCGAAVYVRDLLEGRAHPPARVEEIANARTGHDRVR